MTEIQRILGELQRELGTRVVTGSITLNLHQSLVQNVKTETYTKIPQKDVDKVA